MVQTRVAHLPDSSDLCSAAAAQQHADVIAAPSCIESSIYSPDVNPYNEDMLWRCCCCCCFAQGGESLIGSGEGITAAVPDHIKERFINEGGIKYTRTYPSAAEQPAAAGAAQRISWQQRTGFEDKV